MKKLQVKMLSESAIMPKRAHPDDAGLDIYADETVILKPQDKHLLSTDIAVDIPSGYVGLLTSRSGVSSKTDLVIETGKIDAGFNGEMKIIIKNDEQLPSEIALRNNILNGIPFKELLYDTKGQKIENGNPYEIAIGKKYQINKGDKIAQLVITPIITPGTVEVEDFEEISARGGNGFGSTDQEVLP